MKHLLRAIWKLFEALEPKPAPQPREVTEPPTPGYRYLIFEPGFNVNRQLANRSEHWDA